MLLSQLLVGKVGWLRANIYTEKGVY